jgi:hypothetical protein
MSHTTTLGDGTLTLGSGTPTDFSCEVLGARVTHTYETVGESRTMLCGTVRPAEEKRTDGLGFDIENDLTSAGMYSYILAHDLEETPFVFTPNDADLASWAGSVVLKLPADIGAPEYGAAIVSTVEWAGVGKFTFTPATITAAA